MQQKHAVTNLLLTFFTVTLIYGLITFYVPIKHFIVNQPMDMKAFLLKINIGANLTVIFAITTVLWLRGRKKALQHAK